MTDITELLLSVSAQTGVSGKEGGICAFIENFMKSYSCHVTPLGSLICNVSRRRAGVPHLMLEAHMDEIGLIVTYIEDSGFLRVANVGGIDRKIMTATSIIVHTADGDIPGVVCSTPPHLQKGDSKEISEIFEMAIDIGMSGEQAKAAVHLGDMITFATAPTVLIDGSVSAKALDDRACCAAIMLCAEALAGRELAFGLDIVFATMEETGSQGAKTATYEIAPTHAIALDVSFAHTPDVAENRCGKLKKGPMLGVAPVLSQSMTAELEGLCREQGIPFQIEVMAGATGTDADGIAVSGMGVKTALISIPQRYMHTPVETIAPIDVKNTADLLLAYINYLDKISNIKEAK